MTEQEIEQRLRAWYRAEIEDRESAPFQLRADLPAFAQMARTSRHHLLPEWTLPAMHRFAPLAVAAAVVVVAAAIAYAAMFGSNVGDSAPHASATLTPSLAAPTSTPLPTGPTSTPSIGAEFPVLIDSVKDPGRYYIFGGGVAFDYLGLDVSAVLPPLWQRGNHGRGEFGIKKLEARLDINYVLNGYAETCQAAASQPPELDEPGLGPEVDDLAAALASIPTVDASAPTNVSVGRWEGKRIELTVLPGCEFTYLWTWTDPVFRDTHSMGGQAGSRHQVTILDVAGRRLVIDASYSSDTGEDEQAELRAIVESLEITPSAPE